MAKHKNLQPWLDYFGMLQTYEQAGFLQINVGKHEAYVTQAALLTLAGVIMQPGKDLTASDVLWPVFRIVRRLRTYAAWRSATGGDYLSYSFSINVVEDSERYDPLYTILLTRERRWWKLWMKTDVVGFVSYK